MIQSVARPRVVNCTVCSRHIAECGPLSARKRCIDCGVGEGIKQNQEMAHHSGEYFLDWRRRMARSVGAVLPEDVSADREI